jgi:hypothetical protein
MMDCGLRNADCGFEAARLAARGSRAERRRSVFQSEIRNPQSAIDSGARL